MLAVCTYGISEACSGRMSMIGDEVEVLFFI